MNRPPARRHYPEVPQQPRYPEIEERILEYWARERIFEESVRQRPAGDKGQNEFVFYDGPPFANGLPHYGHLVTGYVKDIVPRYQTMRGRRVERRFGWDCHGLPAEMEAEKELAISGRAQVIDFGIQRFNDHCRSSVMRYTRDWENYVTRQARWVDFRNDYKTMDLPYMESVLWAFKQLHEKGLIYEGFKVVPYSWACETVLANFETRLDESYRERQDPALTVRVDLDPEDGAPPLGLLIWTTTPWTLPSNLALAVGAEIEYAIYEKDGKRIGLAAAAAARYPEVTAGAELRATVRGSELIGRKYRPLFPYFAATAGAFRVLGGDFVTLDEGTGIVHMAPGFGEDDQLLCERHRISVVCPVDHRGRFTSEVPDYAGQLVFDANKAIIRDLKARGVVVRHDTIVHNYPHCWRTDQPLIYKAVTSWYVKVTAFRDRMAVLNREINWVPEHVKEGSFGKWLEGARDWAISRNRFWGTPLPVWKSDDPKHPRIDVYGSLAELERDFGARPADLHRPGIDALTRANPSDPSGKSRMRRVEEVFDCWFESGSMPFAQVHYPFENKEWFENHFPADFIVEYIAQTRGWFYTLMVLSTALFDCPPFRNCICHGVVLDENGRKLSKRLRNYPSPEQVFAEQGADALRWFLTSATLLKGHNLVIDREGKGIGEVVRLLINPLWNAYYFFCLYANADGIRAAGRGDGAHILDRYILAKTRALVDGMTAAFDGYDVPAACAHVGAFIDALNNWYIRRSRDRFWREGYDADKQAAYDTLYTVLDHLVRVLAPLLPLISEEIFRGLTGGRSVHLADWPDASALAANKKLVAEMDLVREVCSAGLSLRKAQGLRVRQPLPALVIAGPEALGLEPYFHLVRDEVNVKVVETTASFGEYADFRLQVNAPVAGPRLGKEMQKVMAAARSGAWRDRGDGTVEVAGQILAAGEFSLVLQPKEGVACQALSGNRIVVVLDTTLTTALVHEGLVRDLVRTIQQARKAAGLHVSDRIALIIEASPALRAAVEAHRDYLMEQTLARELVFGDAGSGEHVVRATIEGEAAAIAIRKLAASS